MDKNLLLAVTLSIAVYAAWFGLIEKRFSPPALTKPGVSAPQDSGKAPPAAAAPAPAPAAGAPATAKEKGALKAAAYSFASGKKTQLGVHPKGAAVVSASYQEPLGSVELVEDPRPGLFATFPELDFRRVEGASMPTFAASRSDGLRVVKEFVPEAEGALPRLRVTLTNAGRKPLAADPWEVSLGTGLGTIETEKEENPKVWRALALRPGAKGLDGKIESFKAGTQKGPFRWIGIDNRYFLAALLAKDDEVLEAATQTPPAVTLRLKGEALSPGASRTWEVSYYLGAKGHTWLSRYGLGLERSIDFGFFAQLGRFVLKVLGILHGWTGNWGWSIILLTILLQVALFPLTYKSLKSMAAMKRLQPEMARLQQKYAKEPARLNQETMELYKKNGANPLGGCLPMLLQMPVFIALYNALRNAWELHGAAWAFWIVDLSAKDPYYVLPVVMGALMWLQNKLNPASTDPNQAMMMNIMPVVFTFMFLKFPAGLVLYWLTNSVVSTVQQLALRDHFANAARA